jgi:hypothetical protein
LHFQNEVDETLANFGFDFDALDGGVARSLCRVDAALLDVLEELVEFWELHHGSG